MAEANEICSVYKDIMEFLASMHVLLSGLVAGCDHYSALESISCLAYRAQCLYFVVNGELGPI